MRPAGPAPTRRPAARTGRRPTSGVSLARAESQGGRSTRVVSRYTASGCGCPRRQLASRSTSTLPRGERSACTTASTSPGRRARRAGPRSRRPVDQVSPWSSPWRNSRTSRDPCGRRRVTTRTRSRFGPGSRPRSPTGRAPRVPRRGGSSRRCLKARTARSASTLATRCPRGATSATSPCYGRAAARRSPRGRRRASTGAMPSRTETMVSCRRTPSGAGGRRARRGGRSWAMAPRASNRVSIILRRASRPASPSPPGGGSRAAAYGRRRDRDRLRGRAGA